MAPQLSLGHMLTKQSLHSPSLRVSTTTTATKRSIYRVKHNLMDALSVFKVFIQVACCLSAVAIFLSPVPAIWRIHKTKSTGPTAIVPLVAMFTSDFLWMLYGIVLHKWFPIFTTFLIGSLSCAVYVLVYGRYSENKRSTIVVSCLALGGCSLVALSVVVSLAFGFCSHASMETFTGVIGTCGSIALYASPFVTLRQVYTTREVKFIPMPMVTMGIISNALWVVDAVLEQDMFVGVPSFIGLVFGLIQAVIYLAIRCRRQPSSNLATLAETMLEKDCAGCMAATPRTTDVRFDSSTTSQSGASQGDEIC